MSERTTEPAMGTEVALTTDAARETPLLGPPSGGWARPAILEAIDPSRHAIIEASAGTGKTYTLEHLVLELVARGVAIEEILVVTFTDKATREMRTRVRERLRLAKSATEAGDPVRARVDAALASFDRASISTIHSFCQRALAEHAFASGRPFAFERVDGRETFGRALRAVLRRGLASSSPTLGAWQSALEALGPGGKVARLEGVLHAWAREPGEVRPRFEPEGAARALLATPSARELVGERWRALEASIPSLTTRARLRDALYELAGRLEPHRDELAERLARADASELASSSVWGAVVAWAASSSDPRGTEGNAVLCARHLAHDEVLGPAFACIHRSLSSPVPFLLHAILPAVLEEWTDEKKRRSTLDFDDMLLELHDALERDARVRSALRARYRHALVDEFQDTDAVQWGIFRMLFVDGEDRGDPGVALPSADVLAPAEVLPPAQVLGPRTLIVIGDAKQAIYGFRSADVHTFEGACAALEAAGGTRARLGESYRSSAAMLEAVHRVLSPAEGEAPFFTGLARQEQALECGLPGRRALAADGSEAPAVVVQHLVGVPELRLPLIRRTHADAIAREILDLVSGGLRTVDDEGGVAGVPEPLGFDDIFVLTRSAAEGQDVAQALRRHGVPHAFFKQDGLFRTEEARDVLDVLRAVAARHDRSLITRALLGPFFGVPLVELPLAHAIPSDHPHARLLQRWGELAEHGQIAGLLRSMLEDSGLARRELYLQQGERALVNYRHLLELVLELATGRRLHVTELVVALAQRIEAAHDPARGGRDDEDIQRLESERDAVQILTMHKSKGLEAEVVFVFGGLGKPPKRSLVPRVFHDASGREDGGGTPLRVAWTLMADGLEDDTVATKLREEVRQEDERLYYVAMTRAKRRLYLPYFGTPPPPLPRRADVSYDPPHLKGSYRVVNERLRALAEAGELGRAPFALQTLEVVPRARARAAKVNLPGPEVHALPAVEQASSGELSRWKERYAGFEITSYTRMKAGRDDGAVELAPSLALLAAEEASAPSQPSSLPELSSVALPSPLPPPSLAHESGGRALDPRAMPTGPGGAAFGVLVHGVLEDLLRREAAPAGENLEAGTLAADPLLETRALQHGATVEEREACVALVLRGLTTAIAHPLLELPRGFGSVGRRAVEMPFLFPVPERSHPPLGVPLSATSVEPLVVEGGLVVERGYVRGVIDLLFEHEDRVFVLDWKTDRLASYLAEDVRSHVEKEYRVQAALYTLATLRALGITDARGYERFGGLLYVFLRGLEPGAEGVTPGLSVLRPRFEEVLEWERAVREHDALWGYPLPPRRHPLSGGDLGRGEVRR